MSTTPTLQRQYEDITAFIAQYVAFVERLIGRASFGHSLVPPGWRRLLVDPIKLKPSAKAAIAAAAGDADRADPFYGVMMSDDTADALSVLMQGRFPGVRFKKVKDLHDLKEPKAASFNFGNYIGVALAVLGGTLQSMSAGAKQQSPVQVTTLDRIAFWTTVTALAYGFVVLFPRWMRHARLKETHRFTDFVLSYTCIETDGD